MRIGLVLGKFMPLHAGHLALVQFALKRCDTLNVVLCSHNKEPINGEVRLKWLEVTFAQEPAIKLHHMVYDTEELPDTSVS